VPSFDSCLAALWFLEVLVRVYFYLIVWERWLLITILFSKKYSRQVPTREGNQASGTHTTKSMYTYLITAVILICDVEFSLD